MDNWRVFQKRTGAEKKGYIRERERKRVSEPKGAKKDSEFERECAYTVQFAGGNRLSIVWPTNLSIENESLRRTHERYVPFSFANPFFTR